MGETFESMHRASMLKRCGLVGANTGLPEVDLAESVLDREAEDRHVAILQVPVAGMIVGRMLNEHHL